MKLTTILLTLVLAFGSILSGQDKKGALKKKTAEVAAEAKEGGKKAAAETKDTAKKAKEGAAAKKKAAADDDDVPQAQRCQATTQAGSQCKRKSAEGSKFCWQHAGGQKKGETKKKAA